MPNQLDRIINFVKKTGDKTIVIKDDNEFVIAPLTEYERLLDMSGNIKDLSEEELLNRINRDVALWRASQSDKNIIEEGLEIDSCPDEYGPRYDHLDSIPDLDSEDNLFPESMPVVDIDGEKDYWEKEGGWGNGDDEGCWDYSAEAENDDDENDDDDHFEFEEPKKEYEEGNGEVDEFESYESEGESSYDSLEESKDAIGKQLSDSGQLEESLKKENKEAGLGRKNHSVGVRTASRRVNNFGYANPSDTVVEDEYGHIAPPPDLNDKD